MRAPDVTGTLGQVSRPRALTTSPSTPRGFIRQWLVVRLGRSGHVAQRQRHAACARGPCHPQTQGKIDAGTRPRRTASCSTTLPARRSRTADWRIRRAPQSRAIMRASKTSRPLTSTLADRRRSAQNANAAGKPATIANLACRTDCRPIRLATHVSREKKNGEGGVEGRG